MESCFFVDDSPAESKEIIAESNVSASSYGEIFTLRKLVHGLKDNFQALQKELVTCREQQRIWQEANGIGEGEVLVARSGLDKVSRELQLLKNALSWTIGHSILPTFSQLSTVCAELESSRELVEAERDHWKSQWESVMETTQSDKEEKLALKCELQDVSQQLTQQSEFCAVMGAACCTLLWRVSRCEESIPSILVGTKVGEFLDLVCSTVESYLQTYSTETAPPDDSDEMQFVLALCGVVTNIAASAYGRDFLMTHERGQQVIEMGLRVLAQEPCSKFAKMKNLMLMALYNLTINQKGLKFLLSRSELLPLLSWQLQGDNELENRQHSLRLLQSLLSDQLTPELLHQATELMQDRYLEEVCSHPNKQLREMALEIRDDLRLLLNQP